MPACFALMMRVGPSSWTTFCKPVQCHGNEFNRKPGVETDLKLTLKFSLLADLYRRATASCWSAFVLLARLFGHKPRFSGFEAVKFCLFRKMLDIVKRCRRSS